MRSESTTMSNLGITFNSWYPNASPSARSSTHHGAAPVQESRPTPGPSATCHFAPFDEHLNVLFYPPPHWQQHLDAYFTHVFSPSVLSQGSINDLALRALQIIAVAIDDPTQPAFTWRLHTLARAICTHWAPPQYRHKNPHVCAAHIVALVSRIARHFGWTSVSALGTFVVGLQHACVERLSLTWRWYVTVVFPGVAPTRHKNMFMRVMTVVTMTGYLFRCGRLGHGAVLNGLWYVAEMSPWPDAVAIIYALLHELGPTFALEQAGSHFVHRFLARLIPLTVDRVHVDPLFQLGSAINMLAAEWRHRTTPVTLYLTPPVGNTRFHAHHSQR